MRRSAVVSLLPCLLFVLGSNPVFAQIGGTNPTGPAGAFNGSVTTGCSYDPSTGNAIRQVTDLALPSVGAYPLAFTRISNSRASAATMPFGHSGSWEHSYDWEVIYNTTTNPKPTSYEIIFPDGRDEVFNSSGTPTSKGIREKVIPLNTTTMLFYLVLPDGGKVEFTTTRYSSGAINTFYSIVTGLIDPYGERTAIGYNTDQAISQITEPGGRYIQLLYVPGSSSAEIDHITGSDGRSVQYSYTTGLDGTPALTGVTYYGDSTIQASYTYQAANVSPTSNYPLLATCDDPMYAGPMKKITYTFATSNADSTIPVAYGQITSENSGTTGQMVSQLVVPVATPAGSKRTENRGDGPSRSFTYSTAGFLTSFTDFYGVAATQGYDTNGFLNSYTDRNGNQTSLTNDPGTGNILTITYPSTPSDTPTGTPRGTVSYVYGSSTCPDPNNKDPHYLYSATDEGGHATTYLRDSQYRVTTINYPDTG
ncbi:MAG: hypothetical protein JO354_05960, partial [Verrucomicrobia bacterium]|nr:hypothetical protein [Verrucomicrobiota bacterium]